MNKRHFFEYLSSLAVGIPNTSNENIFLFEFKFLAFYFYEIENFVNEKEYLKKLILEYAQKGIRLIIIYEPDWIIKRAVVMGRIEALFGKSILIHGRKTIAKRIDKVAAETFLNENHLQAYVSSKIKYGLYLKSELVAVATFSAGRKMNDKPSDFRSYELIRFANKNGHRVYGGLSKLLKAFIVNHNPGNIMTYADSSWSVGESYLKLGFEQVGFLEPQMYYFDRQTYQKINLNNDTTLEPDKIVGIWNAGSLKFVLNINNLKN